LNLIEKYLSDRFPKSAIGLAAVGGGSINDAYRVTLDEKPSFFLKVNSVSKFPGLFEKENSGLEFLAQQNLFRVPSVVSYDVRDDRQLLLLEWIESGSRNENFWKKFGEQLAQLHSKTSDTFGFHEDNYMGSLPQCNTPTTKWTDFFITCRLQPQIDLAMKKNLLDKNQAKAFETLYPKLNSIFNIEKPSLLHGDLWSGNFMCDDKSSPVLVDPAVYYGHRSMDLAMTTMFGGFDKAFYEAYHHHYPFPSSYRDQWDICNLYPLLIHLNLFGQSYLAGILRTLNRLNG
jgi:protein-ribulosamine 3-kinase